MHPLIRSTLKRIPFARSLYRKLKNRSRSEAIDDRDDALMRRILVKLLRPESNAVDVGAHAGTMMAEMLRLAPRGRHFAFEAIPALAAELVGRWPQVEARNVAVGADSGEIEFNWVATNPAFSGIELRTDLRPEDAVEKIRVRLEPLDALVPADVVVRLVKIDVEGAELGVLRGAERVLSRDRPFVLFEHGSASALYGTTSADVFEEFRLRGLNVWRFDRWLAGLPAYSLADFAADVAAGDHWNFLAGPSELPS